ncbi:Putative GTP cyclohydrolase 1 type 2, NIF3 family [Gracilibacillus ureilyticus]|uniref:GTP cyclohydrolase 1 type 2 homolog n=1 Tax=Gracilibacillus ureilyticus TaxID=531814 RepID=A0A1H9PS60_9BACI|nr:Nif3-like dinuclear metal center hexameric protein [Gracilibacillus ureilyticus]SER50948.1 Putative GTP cyclohydrolase 1 type 2, NIF3 family [Gracilibacillus ureilyticus]
MNLQVREVINIITKPVGIIPDTVDMLLFGSDNQSVDNIGVAFMPTYENIRKCVEMDINLLVCHEGVFYSHSTDVPLNGSSIIVEKQRLIEKSGISIFRLHDYIHNYKPDLIMKGLIRSLCWEDNILEHKATSSVLQLPKITLNEIITYIKNKLNLPYLHFIGDLTMEISKVGLLVGFRGGGANAIPLFEEDGADLVIYGEGPEWETPEYVRDAMALGKQKAVIILGHRESEEPGMKLFAKELQTIFPDTPVNFLVSNAHIHLY